MFNSSYALAAFILGSWQQCQGHVGRGQETVSQQRHLPENSPEEDFHWRVCCLGAPELMLQFLRQPCLDIL